MLTVKFDENEYTLENYNIKDFYEIYKNEIKSCKKISLKIGNDGNNLDWWDNKLNECRFEYGIKLKEMKDNWFSNKKICNFIHSEEIKNYETKPQLIFTIDNETHFVYQDENEKAKLKYHEGKYYYLDYCIYSENDKTIILENLTTNEKFKIEKCKK